MGTDNSHRWAQITATDGTDAQIQIQITATDGTDAQITATDGADAKSRCTDREFRA
jgi:hypothetical protein